MYFLDSSLKTPLYEQLYLSLKDDIIHNAKIGDKLPSIRKLSALYGISKNTVETAFSQLYAEGYIESRQKSGYFVSHFKEHELEHLTKTSSHVLVTPTPDYVYDFFPARLSKDSFPLKLWKRLYNKAITHLLDFGAYPNRQGEIPLRYEIARYLKASRGVVCHEDHVIIVSSFAEAMEMVAKIFKSHTNQFGIETPGYLVTHNIFSHYGYHVNHIPMNEHGIFLDALEKTDVKLLYITPSHQYPTGITMPITQRLHLLDWAQKNDAYIIEDDYDSELSYKTKPIPALQGLDTHEKVIYVGTFSKSLSPALRVGYVVLPPSLLKLYHSLIEHRLTHAYVSLSTQHTLALFMKEGHWERHLRKIRNINRKKHDMMKKELIHALGHSMKIIAEGSGLALLIVPTQPFNYTYFKQKAQELGVHVYFMQERSCGEFEAIAMGFGGLMEKEIPQAIALFKQAWDAALV